MYVLCYALVTLVTLVHARAVLCFCDFADFADLVHARAVLCLHAMQKLLQEPAGMAIVSTIAGEAVQFKHQVLALLEDHGLIGASTGVACVLVHNCICISACVST